MLNSCFVIAYNSLFKSNYGREPKKNKINILKYIKSGYFKKYRIIKKLRKDIKIITAELILLDLVRLNKEELTQKDKEKIFEKLSNYKDSIQKNTDFLSDLIDKKQDELKK